MPDSGPDDTPSAGKGTGGGGGGGAPSSMAGTSALPQAGTTSSTAGTTSKAGSSSGGMNTGTAGSSHAGSAGTGAGGGGGSTAGTGSGAGGKTSTNLPFSEDFEDGAANGFIPWNDKSTAGPWVVVADGAGKVYQPQAPLSDLEFAVGGSTTWTDVAMTVKVRLNDADTDGQVVLRFKEPKTYLVVEIAEGKFKLRGRADGSTTDLISPSPKPVITAGTWYTVGVTVKGTAVNLTLDGKAIGAQVTCNALISNGGVALGADSGSISFDDLTVAAAP